VTYSTRLLDELQPTPGWTLVTDDPAHHYLRHFARWQPEITSGGAPWQAAALIARHRRIVLGNSTLAWWAAFVADATYRRAVWMPHNFQPYGRAQEGDQHKKPGESYMSDLRVPGWHVVDMDYSIAYDPQSDRRKMDAGH
jgi:hypothetical protein